MRFIPIFFILTINLFSQSFYTQNRVKQGEPITFVVKDVKGDYDYTFGIFDGSRKLGEFKGFNYYLVEEKIPIILGLGGIPSDLEPGFYQIKATGKGFFDTQYFEEKIEIISGNYGVKTVSANTVMTELAYGERDPQRDIQAKKWWEVLTKVNPFAKHHHGYLKKPVEGDRVTSPFGFTREFIYPNGKKSKTIHYGEDYGLPIGTPVLASASGIVVFAEERIISGNTIIIEHLPGLYSMYYHLDSIDIKVGDEVTTQTQIGKVGNTGFSTGPHLHWEVRIGTISVNPNYYIRTPLIDKTLIIDMINTK